MRNRVFRALICLVVICALIFNISPIRAEATSGGVVEGVVAGFFTTIPVGWAVAGCLLAIGIGYGVATGAFDGLVTAISDTLSSGTYVDNGMVSVYVQDGKSYLDSGLIEAIRALLFGETGALVSVNTPALSPAGTTIPWNADNMPTATLNFPAYIFTSSGVIFVCCSSQYKSQNAFSYNGSGFLYTGSSNYIGYNDLIYTYYAFYGSKNPNSSLPNYSGLGNYSGYSDFCVAVLKGNIAPSDPQISTSLDLTLGDVAPANQDLATG